MRPCCGVIISYTVDITRCREKPNVSSPGCTVTTSLDGSKKDNVENLAKIGPVDFEIVDPTGIKV